MPTQKEWREVSKNLEGELEEGVLKVTKEFIKGIRDLVIKQKQTESIEKLANSLGVIPEEEKGKFDYDPSELDECEIEITEE